MEQNSLKTTCCIVGGGPAGMFLGYLLARSGVDVVVLEKHKDFFRDFRGDTIHPSTLENLREVGLLDEFLTLRHEKTYQMVGEIGAEKLILADFSKLKVHNPYIVFMPQWDFLNFLKEKAEKLPTFHLYMESEVTGLREDKNRITGVEATHKGKAIEIIASLVIGADGRTSTVRKKSGLSVKKIGVPIDVMWFHISRKKDDPQVSLGRMDKGHIMVMIQRGDYWQCGLVIPKGRAEQIKEKGLSEFHKLLTDLQPLFKERASELQSWDDVKLLSVSIDRLKTWSKSGLLCIGDSAHAMSPIGGVGINLAIQDAVATANILAPKLLTNTLTDEDLMSVQKRREFPTKVTQRVQMAIQNKIFNSVLKHKEQTKMPLIFKLIKVIPYLQRFPAHFVGIGVRPEHISPYLKKIYSDGTKDNH